MALTLALTACAGTPSTDGGEEPSGATSSSSAGEVETTSASVPTKHLLGRIEGRLPKAKQRHLLKQVSRVVDDWLDQAFAGGTFPREISGAWSSFTPGAARLARRDRDLTSLAGLAPRIDGVRVTKRAVRYVVLAPGGKPAGVTARITLDLHTNGESSRKVSLRGRLALTRLGKGWQVFSYDLTRGER